MVLQYNTVKRSVINTHDLGNINIIQKAQDTVIHLKVDEEQMADHTRK